LYLPNFDARSLVISDLPTTEYKSIYVHIRGFTSDRTFLRKNLC
jgi:hypothetical protein